MRTRGCSVSACEKGQRHVCHTQCVKVGASVINPFNLQAKIRLALASITDIRYVCNDLSHFSMVQSKSSKHFILPVYPVLYWKDVYGSRYCQTAVSGGL